MIFQLRLRLIFCLIILALTTLLGCGVNNVSLNNVANNTIDNTFELATNKAEAEAVNDITATPNAIYDDSSIINDEVSDLPIVSILEHGLHLYPVEDGVLLKYKDIEQKMDWTYTTPRQIMPSMQLYDFDDDSNDELAVVLNIGSGTGVSIDELHIVEFSEPTSDPNLVLVDHIFYPNDYIKLAFEVMDFEKVYMDGELYAEIGVSDQIYNISLHEFVEWAGEDKIGDTLTVGNIVHFELLDNQILFTAAVGITIEDIFEPQYIGEIKASVSYLDEQFNLTKYSFIPQT